MKKTKSLPASKQDLKNTEKKLDKKIDSVEKKLDKKIDSVEKILREEIKLTAEETKRELKEEMMKNTSKILNIMDKFLPEIKASREERKAVNYRLSNHRDRIEKLEKTILPAAS